MNDILGQALFDHYYGRPKHKLWIHNKYGPKEEMPVDTYFRAEGDMPDLEWLALNVCQGKVLDIGAGAGSHSLLLQAKGLDVCALDISTLAAQVMQARGVNKVMQADIFEMEVEKFDTLVLLMNGIGLAGTLDGLHTLLLKLKTMLNYGGQILLDSSDVAYLHTGGLPQHHYYGEIDYQYAYKRQKSPWFKWLYIDERTLGAAAAQAGFSTDVLLEDEFGQYLARLRPVDS